MKVITRLAAVAVLVSMTGLSVAEESSYDKVLVPGSYAIGFKSGEALSSKLSGFSVPDYVDGMSHALVSDKRERRLSESEMNAAIVAYQSAENGAREALSEKEIQNASYAVGFKSGEKMAEQARQFDVHAFLEGISDGLKVEDHSAKYTPTQMDEFIVAYQKMKREDELIDRVADAEAALIKAREFLKSNARKDDVVVLPSGLQFKVLEASEKGGKNPDLNDVVSIDYHGTRLNGEVFDSSVERGKPVKLIVSKAINGLSRAITLMQVGEKWRVFLPPELGYGEDGSGPVGPNEVLIYEIKLLGIE